MTWENRLIFEVSSADPDAVPVWVDFTLRIRDAVDPISLTIGRQNDLEQSEPARLELTLDNADGALTYGNTLSPYAAWWGPGRKCRLRETVAGVESTLFTGYLAVPTEGLITADIEQRVTITAVDRLDRLQSAEPFASALSEYILHTTDLKGYWPLTDAVPPYRGLGPATDAMVIDSFVVAGQQGATAQALAQRGLAPPGGERSGLRMLVGRNDADVVTSYSQISWESAVFQPAVGTNDSVTVVMWLSTTGTTFANQVIASVLLSGSSNITLMLARDLATGAWTLTASGAMSATIAIGAVGTALLPVGIRFTMAPANMELWVGGQRYTATPTGVPPTGVVIFQGNFGSLPIDLDISHMQVYVGTTYSYADYLEQITQGYTPLERQPTGDRVRTILRYAGVPDAEVTQVDTGSSIMQAARLAGQTPLQALRVAERTEQGLLYVDGSGNVGFKDRRTLYNI